MNVKDVDYTKKDDDEDEQTFLRRCSFMTMESRGTVDNGDERPDTPRSSCSKKYRSFDTKKKSYEIDEDGQYSVFNSESSTVVSTETSSARSKCDPPGLRVELISRPSVASLPQEENENPNDHHYDIENQKTTIKEDRKNRHRSARTNRHSSSNYKDVLSKFTAKQIEYEGFRQETQDIPDPEKPESNKHNDEGQCKDGNKDEGQPLKDKNTNGRQHETRNMDEAYAGNMDQMYAQTLQLPVEEEMNRASQQQNNYPRQNEEMSAASESARPGAHAIPGIMDETHRNHQNFDEMTTTTASTGHQTITAVVAQLVPDNTDTQNNDNITNMEAENNELRRQLQERDEQPMAHDAKVVNTWICGFSKYQVVMIVTLMMIAVIIAVVLIIVMTMERGEKNIINDEMIRESLIGATEPNTLSHFHNKAHQWILNDEYTVNMMKMKNDGKLQQDNDDLSQHLLERYVLAIIYFDTMGETNWKNKYHFLSSKSHCDWYNIIDGTLQGVQCSNSFIIQLDLGSNQLDGVIPTDIGYLSSLEYLNFGKNNDISGPIPTEIGNLVNLKDLHLNGNRLKDTIPNEIWKLVNLEHLILESNQLKGTIPTNVGELVKLKELTLSHNHFSGNIPTEIRRLRDLETLSLDDNDLSGNIDSVFCNGGFDSLESLTADCSTDPPEIVCTCCTKC